MLLGWLECAMVQDLLARNMVCTNPNGQIRELKDMALPTTPLTPGLLASYSRCTRAVAVSTHGTMYIYELVYVHGTMYVRVVFS